MCLCVCIYVYIRVCYVYVNRALGGSRRTAAHPGPQLGKPQPPSYYRIHGPGCGFHRTGPMHPATPRPPPGRMDPEPGARITGNRRSPTQKVLGRKIGRQRVMPATLLPGRHPGRGDPDTDHRSDCACVYVKVFMCLSL